MGAEAKRYLQEHSIPQLFESFMTGLIYNKPENPLEFLENAISEIRKKPELALKWDSFVDSSVPPRHIVATDEKPKRKSRKKESKDSVQEEQNAAGGRASKTGNRAPSRGGNQHKSSSPSRLISRRKTITAIENRPDTSQSKKGRRTSVARSDSRLIVSTGYGQRPATSTKNPEKKSKKSTTRSTKGKKGKKAEASDKEVESTEEKTAAESVGSSDEEKSVHSEDSESSA